LRRGAAQVECKPKMLMTFIASLMALDRLPRNPSADRE
jgi:hypothetical protein